MKQIVMVPIVKQSASQSMSPSANLAKDTVNMNDFRSLAPVFRGDAAVVVKHNEAEGSSRNITAKIRITPRNLSKTLAQRNRLKGGFRNVKFIVAKEPTVTGCMRCQKSKKPCFARFKKIGTERRGRKMWRCERCTALKKGCKWVGGIKPNSVQECSSIQASSTSVGSKRKTDEIMEQTSPGELSALSKKQRINEETRGLPNTKVFEASSLADPTTGVDDGLPIIRTLDIDEPDNIPRSNTTQGSILRYLHAMDLSMKAYERAYKGILKDVMKKLRDEKAGGTFGESAPRMEDAFRQWYRKEKARTDVESQRHV